MAGSRLVRVAGRPCGLNQPLLWIAGPCVIESHDLTLSIAETLAGYSEKMGFSLVFKASFDKANRTSGKSFRGPGLDEGLKTLDAVKRKVGLPVTTDLHECHQVEAVGQVCDLLQIPAFLARQTDLVLAAGRTGKAINVKKGQFMAPWDMKNVVSKMDEAGNPNLLLTERGTTFGYGQLVNDMRAIPWMQDLGRPVIFDATHSVQTPGSMGSSTGGDRRMVPFLARAAVAAGCDGIFIETHPRPNEALSDGPNMIALDDLPELIRICTRSMQLSIGPLLRDLMNFVLPPNWIRVCFFFLLAGATFNLGCGSSNQTEKAPPPLPGSSTDETVVNAVAKLASARSSETCRDALQALDSVTTFPIPKPRVDEQKLVTLGSLLKLDKQEVDAIGQPNFNTVDAEYVADCLLIRDIVQSLGLKNEPPLRQAERVFSFVCRQIYIIKEPRIPAPSWWILQAGCGSGVDRSYVYLACLRQLGLDGCLIGPPELATSPNLVEFKDKAKFAPIRALGVRVGADIFLFDPWHGKPITIDSKIVTLAQLRSKPEAAAEWLKSASIEAAEVRKWQIFLTEPLQASEPRMEWLEQLLPSSGMKVRFYTDFVAMFERFQKETLVGDLKNEVKCLVWNVDRDPLSFVRLLTAFNRETKLPDGTLIQEIKFRYRMSHIPQVAMGQWPVVGTPFQVIRGKFLQAFDSSLLAPNSPRDNLLRGQYSLAVSTLSSQKAERERVLERSERNRATQEEVNQWCREASEVFADHIRAKEGGKLDEINATRMAEAKFSNGPLTEKIFNRIDAVTARIIVADEAYQLALLSHERAEQADARLKDKPDERKRTEAINLWQAALDSWQRWIGHYPELKGVFADRDAQARQLLGECKAALAQLQGK